MIELYKRIVVGQADFVGDKSPVTLSYDYVRDQEAEENAAIGALMKTVPIGGILYRTADGWEGWSIETSYYYLKPHPSPAGAIEFILREAKKTAEREERRERKPR